MVINPDGLKSRNRPRAKILKLMVRGTIAGTDHGMLLQRLNSLPDSGSEANRHVGKIQANEIIAKLAHHIVAEPLARYDNLHERWPDLCSASKASVCAFTEPQNSSSASSFDARPSASRASSSSRCPRKARHGPLFDCGQGCIHDFLNRLVGAPVHHVVNPPLLLGRKLNRHTVPPLVFVTFRIREKPLSGNEVEQGPQVAQALLPVPRLMDSVHSAPRCIGVPP